MELKKNTNMGVHEQFRQLITALSERLMEMQSIEKNFSEDVALPDNGEWFARAVSLSIQRDRKNEGEAYLGLNLLHPHGMCNASTGLSYGNKSELLEFLNDKDCVENLIDKARVCDKKFKEWDEE